MCTKLEDSQAVKYDRRRKGMALLALLEWRTGPTKREAEAVRATGGDCMMVRTPQEHWF
jgi:hypothetical protein